MKVLVILKSTKSFRFDAKNNSAGFPTGKDGLSLLPSKDRISTKEYVSEVSVYHSTLYM
jgi:hypothetical protein